MESRGCVEHWQKFDQILAFWEWCARPPLVVEMGVELEEKGKCSFLSLSGWCWSQEIVAREHDLQQSLMPEWFFQIAQQWGRLCPPQWVQFCVLPGRRPQSESSDPQG